jgi:hypothetical protein
VDAQPDRDPVNSAEKHMRGHAGVPDARSGNAPAHSAADQIAVLEQGLEQPPREVVADLDTEIVLRADSAGSALALCQAARDTRDRLRRPASRSSGRPLTPRNCSEGRRPPS